MATLPYYSNCIFFFPTSVQDSLPLLPLALLNISFHVSDTFANISWIARNEPRDSQLYVAYMNNREGTWRISEPVNTSQSSHVIDGLEPGAAYTVRLIAKHLLDNASVFEDVIQTQVKGEEQSQRRGI
ncbi:Neural cell adhesion molecule L1-like protein [Merluccius polli]|uniref:Neural cell adhesion molecule L1-like protein n=1 Tax=Merluccius polli TaxID=89951 RepID=A0AA47N9F2_MERPO|nr:Neural cell adhesion molecule L1-like protein [Merluccius polli]